ncbi:MAG: aldo/keto reductase [Qingshengfaniella sp.]
MRYRLLGGSGLRVSEVALGTMTFGETKGWGADEAEARAILGAFAEAGGVFLDTAPSYAGGAAECIVGDFIKGDRDRFVIGTKFTASNDRHILAGGNSAAAMIRSVECSLRQLGTDYIDLLWLHYWDGTTPLAEILRGFEALIAAGKIRYVGFSDTPAWIVSRAVTMAEMRGWAVPAAVQIEYSLAARDAERDLLPMAEALGLSAVCWGPLAAGALAAGGDPQRRPADKVPGPLRAAADRVATLAAEAGMSPRALALAWLMRHPTRMAAIPILGARRAGQLAENLAALDGPVLDADLAAALDAATAPRLGFPHDLIKSNFLRRLALGDPEALIPPNRPRA